MLRCVYWLCLAGAFREPITADNWTRLGEGALPDCIGWMIGWWFVCLVALWYCEQVVVVGHGTAREPLFFVRKQFWADALRSVGLGGAEISASSDSGKTAVENAPKDEKNTLRDVEAERQRAYDKTSSAAALRILSLRKLFPSAVAGAPPKVAVNSVSLAVNHNECCGLLGHNGTFVVVLYVAAPEQKRCIDLPRISPTHRPMLIYLRQSRVRV